MSRPLYRRVAKLEAVSRPPMRIVFEYVYETPELTSKRFINREVFGNVEFEFWEGPGAACEPLVLPAEDEGSLESMARSEPQRQSEETGSRTPRGSRPGANPLGACRCLRRRD